MANQLPEGLTRQEIYNLQDAAQKFYPVEIGKIKGGKPVSGWSKWSSKEVFDDEVFTLTGYRDIIKSYDQLGQWAQVAPVKKELNATTLEKGQLETLQAADTKREAERQKAIEASNKKVRDSIEAQKNAHDKLESLKKNAWVKANAPVKPELGKDDLEFVSRLKASPREEAKLLADEIERGLNASLSGQLSKAQVRMLAVDAAYKAADAAVNPEKYIEEARQAAILKALSKDDTTLPKIITDAESLTAVRTAAEEVSTFKSLQTLSARSIVGAVRPDAAKYLFSDPNGFGVEISESHAPGFYSFEPAGLTNGYINFLGNNANFFAKLAGLPVDQVQSELTKNATSWIERQIAVNFPEVSGVFSSEESQLLFRSLGFGAPINVELTGAFGQFFIENPAFTPLLDIVSSVSGINFGVGTAASMAAATTATAETVAATGGMLASEAFLGGAAVAAAPITGGASLLVAAVAGFVGPKVVKTLADNLQKASKFIVGGVGAVFGGLLIGGYTGAIIGFGVGYGGATLAAGGISALSASAAGVAAATTGAFGVIWATFLEGIGTPILVTLIGFPVAVAIILFIINSGAYVVPLGFSAGGTADIICNTTQTTESPAANAATCIVSYLDQFRLNPLTVGLLSSAAWKNLVAVLAAPALDALESSAHVDGHLQCVGFAAATAGLAYGQAFTQINACSYIEHPPAGYRYIEGTRNIRSGDFFLINGSKGCSSASPGHIGVVISVDGALISCADANAVAPGKARTSHGCFALSQLTGYLRK